MPKLYDFTRLIAKYSTTFQVISASKGEYVDGVYQSGTETITNAVGAIVPMAERKVYQSGGSYTQKDRSLYMSTEITVHLKDTRIRYKDNIYSIEEDTDWSEYADTHVYVLKWVSRFDRGAGND